MKRIEIRPGRIVGLLGNIIPTDLVALCLQRVEGEAVVASPRPSAFDILAGLCQLVPQNVQLCGIFLETLQRVVVLGVRIDLGLDFLKVRILRVVKRFQFGGGLLQLVGHREERGGTFVHRL